MSIVKTTVQLSRAVEVNGRNVDAVTLRCGPGSDRLPLRETGAGFAIDSLEVMSIIVRRTGLTKPAIEKLSQIDLLAITMTLFLPSAMKARGRSKSKG